MLILPEAKSLVSSFVSENKHCQIAAKTDPEAIAIWLKARASRSAHTLRSSILEVRRFILWMNQIGLLSLASVRFDHLLQYQHFLQNLDGLPHPEIWIGAKKPFKGALSPSSINKALAVLKSLFGFLHKAAYLVNDVSALLQIEQTRAAMVERYLNAEHIRFIQQTLLSLPCENSTQMLRKTRLNWIFMFAIKTGLRLEELSQAHTGNLKKIDKHWYLLVSGKGRSENEHDLVAVTPELLQNLKEYRLLLGFNALPSQDEKTPLIGQVHRPSQAITSRTLALLFAEIFAEAEQAARRANLPDYAQLYAKASPHWLRHSLGTLLVNNGMDLRNVAKIMRHRNIATTMRYLHTEIHQLHDEIRDKGF